MRVSGITWIVVLVSLAGCVPDFGGIPVLSGFGTTDEEAIAHVMNDVHRGMESRRIYKVLSHVSPNYSDAEGRDYEQIKQHVSTLLRRYGKVRIDRVRPRIIVDGERARVFEVFATRAEPLPGTSAVPVVLQGQVTVYLQKEGGKWKIVEWGHLG